MSREVPARQEASSTRRTAQQVFRYKHSDMDSVDSSFSSLSLDTANPSPREKEKKRLERETHIRFGLAAALLGAAITELTHFGSSTVNLGATLQEAVTEQCLTRLAFAIAYYAAQVSAYVVRDHSPGKKAILQVCAVNDLLAAPPFELAQSWILGVGFLMPLQGVSTVDLDCKSAVKRFAVHFRQDGKLSPLRTAIHTGFIVKLGTEEGVSLLRGFQKAVTALGKSLKGTIPPDSTTLVLNAVPAAIAEASWQSSPTTGPHAASESLSFATPVRRQVDGETPQSNLAAAPDGAKHPQVNHRTPEDINTSPTTVVDEKALLESMKDEICSRAKTVSFHIDHLISIRARLTTAFTKQANTLLPRSYHDDSICDDFTTDLVLDLAFSLGALFKIIVPLRSAEDEVHLLAPACLDPMDDVLDYLGSTSHLKFERITAALIARSMTERLSWQDGSRVTQLTMDNNIGVFASKYDRDETFRALFTPVSALVRSLLDTNGNGWDKCAQELCRLRDFVLAIQERLQRVHGRDDEKAAWFLYDAGFIGRPT